MLKKITTSLLISLLVGSSTLLVAQEKQESTNTNAFRQMYQEFSTPNVYRSANGAPGHQYYQQKANYKMKVRIDDERKTKQNQQTI